MMTASDDLIYHNGNQYLRSGGLANPQPYILAQEAVPIIMLSSATSISDTGAITGLTALPYTPIGVVQVYCFAQTGLAAGLYYARFSSVTACQLYTDAAGTVTPTGITAGAYTGGVGTQPVLSINVPAGSLGPNGALDVCANYSYSNSANNKTCRWNIFDGTYSADVAYFIYTTTSIAGTINQRLRNRGAEARNYTSQNLGAAGASSVANTYSVTSVDTGKGTVLRFTPGLANVADFIILESYCVTIYPGA